MSAERDSIDVTDSAWDAIDSERAAALRARLSDLRQVVVAFSGGVDSAVVARAARACLGADHCRLVMAVGPAVPESEVREAREIAAQIELELTTVDAQEWLDPDYLRNDERRCYYCKSHLYQTLERFRLSLPEPSAWRVINGVNVEDLGDYRPGLEAAREASVVAPLAEAGLTKADIRRLAAAWGLTVHDKPATPCLASRIAYGESVTVERLAMIERAERCLRDLGLRELRVRYHANDLARIEVPLGELPRLSSEDVRQALVEALRGIGFRFITLDLEGFRSGSLNALVSPSALVRITPSVE